MTEHLVVMKLNQQQLELLDRTIARGIAPDRTSLVRLALREYAAAHQNDAQQNDAQQSAVAHQGERK
jgi:metal-responsive CopG/Arc/MetJ family transcriptional regulator